MTNPPTPPPQAEREKLKRHFEQNMLDADPVQPGQMLSSVSVLEHLQDFAEEYHASLLDKVEASIPGERVDLDRETMPYPAGQANGWNDVVGQWRAAIKKLREQL